ncbi:hypothetical protein EFK50_09160 [Nocardioides marmoriginsengisoli]|uniref:DUF3592 domain-containing protein n=1 Tax=Nocardioides marmoriginsengisoli TaxID=661483 RepID=A0A3N0CEY0_9ACTN|nr:hypothetical protein [Nocardioides marmoriginsengisoli]RNL61988.1 hypothetical protein EFK50_09160 [Nocardioides marmoriginsengisoli]
MRALLWLLVLFLVNLPYVHETRTDRKIAEDGHDVVATVLDARELNGHYLVDYRLPKSEDPDGTKFSASIDEPTYEHAVRSDAIGVRVLEGRPGSNRPDGLVPSSLFKVVAISGDAVLLLIAVLAWYRRRNPGDAPDPNPRPVGL